MNTSNIKKKYEATQKFTMVNVKSLKEHKKRVKYYY